MPTAAEELGAYESDTEVAWDLVIFANSPSLPFLDVFFMGGQVLLSQIFRVYSRLHDVLMAFGQKEVAELRCNLAEVRCKHLLAPDACTVSFGKKASGSCGTRRIVLKRLPACHVARPGWLVNISRRSLWKEFSRDIPNLVLTKPLRRFTTNQPLIESASQTNCAGRKKNLFNVEASFPRIPFQMCDSKWFTMTTHFTNRNLQKRRPFKRDENGEKARNVTFQTFFFGNVYYQCSFEFLWDSRNFSKKIGIQVGEVLGRILKWWFCCIIEVEVYSNSARSHVIIYLHVREIWFRLWCACQELSSALWKKTTKQISIHWPFLLQFFPIYTRTIP